MSGPLEYDGSILGMLILTEKEFLRFRCGLDYVSASWTSTFLGIGKFDYTTPKSEDIMYFPGPGPAFSIPFQSW